MSASVVLLAMNDWCSCLQRVLAKHAQSAMYIHAPSCTQRSMYHWTTINGSMSIGNEK